MQHKTKIYVSDFPLDIMCNCDYNNLMERDHKDILPLQDYYDSNCHKYPFHDIFFFHPNWAHNHFTTLH